MSQREIDAETRAKGQRLVYFLADTFWKPYKNDTRVTMGDFVSWGQEGLEIAYRRWNPSIAKFTVYAYYWVRYKIQCGISEWNGYHRNSPQYVKDAEFEEFHEEAPHFCSPEDLPTDEMRELHTHILLLPYDLYTIILFKFFYDLTPKEIEAITGIPSASIPPMIERAIELLREKYHTDAMDDTDSAA